MFSLCVKYFDVSSSNNDLIQRHHIIVSTTSSLGNSKSDLINVIWIDSNLPTTSFEVDVLCGCNNMLNFSSSSSSLNFVPNFLITDCTLKSTDWFAKIYHMVLSYHLHIC